MQTRLLFLCSIARYNGSSGPRCSSRDPENNGTHSCERRLLPVSGCRAHLHPIDFAKAGYVEEEFLLSGNANVYDWAADGSLSVKTEKAPYTTRILVRRPAQASHFSGNVVVEPFMPARRYDWPIMWSYIHQSLMEHGDAWVGVTVPATSGCAQEIQPGTLLRRVVCEPGTQRSLPRRAARMDPLISKTDSASIRSARWAPRSKAAADRWAI